MASFSDNPHLSLPEHKVTNDLIRKVCVSSILFSLKFVRKGLIVNKSALIQVMTWRRRNDKLLIQTMLTPIYDATWHHCVILCWLEVSRTIVIWLKTSMPSYAFLVGLSIASIVKYALMLLISMNVYLEWILSRFVCVIDVLITYLSNSIM